MATFQTLPGFREFYPEDCAARNFIFDRFRQTAKSFAFEEYDAPIIEPTELFTAKSGEEIVSQLFNFEDKGGRQISIRPELTPSLAKMVGSRANAMKKPIKWFNIGEQFRYERPQRGRLRSFYQFNADILGDNSPNADGEIIALAIQTLKSFSLTENDFHVRLSDRKLWTALIESYDLAGDGIQAALATIDRSEREGEAKTKEALEKICPSKGKEIFKGMQRLKNVRSLQDLEKFCVTCENSTDAIRRSIEFSSLLERIDALELADFVSIDFGIVRGLAYYTGFVFEIFERSGQSRALAGGGRYDNLMGKLGYSDLPAVGFAIGDVTLGNLLGEKNLIPAFSKEIRCFIVYTEQTEKIAMGQATVLRERNLGVDYCLNATSFGKQLKAASQAGAKFAVIFGDEEVKTHCAKIKNMLTGEEKLIPIDNLVEGISQ